MGRKGFFGRGIRPTSRPQLPVAVLDGAEDDAEEGKKGAGFLGALKPPGSAGKRQRGKGKGGSKGGLGGKAGKEGQTAEGAVAREGGGDRGAAIGVAGSLAEELSAADALAEREAKEHTQLMKRMARSESKRRKLDMEMAIARVQAAVSEAATTDYAGEAERLVEMQTREAEAAEKQKREAERAEEEERRIKAAMEAAAVPREGIVIHVRDQHGAQLAFTTKLDTPLGRLFAEYARKRGVERSACAFQFDGDALGDASTAREADIEDEDLVDVKVAE